MENFTTWRHVTVENSLIHCEMYMESDWLLMTNLQAPDQSEVVLICDAKI